ncbi:MAG TPA: pyridoxamine 5'-phosphate oxidase family protein [Jatrophihabitans sp.]|uniref:pyridoxamine 5'-phosphate oxidase family protein n=1 Tax=Jatrophihabitans sp. TaxID=1932789 RepID=UPI002EF8D6A1
MSEPQEDDESMGTEQDCSSPALSPDACWALLRAVETGRLGLVVNGEPDIFPVTFLVDHGTVVFRTAPGTKLTAALNGPRVAFEADGVDAAAGQAWSVVAKGRAEEVTQLHELLDTTALPLFPWHTSPKHHLIRIVVDEVTGRRFSIADRASWYMPLVDVPRVASE